MLVFIIPNQNSHMYICVQYVPVSVFCFIMYVMHTVYIYKNICTNCSMYLRNENVSLSHPQTHTLSLPTTAVSVQAEQGAEVQGGRGQGQTDPAQERIQ